MNYAEPFFDNHYQDDPSRASSYEIGTPESAREIPCENSCPRIKECENNGFECKAFRNWSLRGNYDDKDVERLLRKSKNL
jgi:hypothetical protein|tara:strand:- start:603 stop:842 length:240 start_codon:yes stop_codon:yes gene_type:complete